MIFMVKVKNHLFSAVRRVLVNWKQSPGNGEKSLGSAVPAGMYRGAMPRGNYWFFSRACHVGRS